MRVMQRSAVRATEQAALSVAGMAVGETGRPWLRFFAMSPARPSSADRIAHHPEKIFLSRT
jgi:hypothetical protein